MAPFFEQPAAAALEAPLRVAPKLVAPEPGTYLLCSRGWIG